MLTKCVKQTIIHWRTFCESSIVNCIVFVTTATLHPSHNTFEVFSPWIMAFVVIVTMVCSGLVSMVTVANQEMWSHWEINKVLSHFCQPVHISSQFTFLYILIQISCGGTCSVWSISPVQHLLWTHNGRVVAMAAGVSPPSDKSPYCVCVPYPLVAAFLLIFSIYILYNWHILYILYNKQQSHLHYKYTFFTLCGGCDCTFVSVLPFGNFPPFPFKGLKTTFNCFSGGAEYVGSQ